MKKIIFPAIAIVILIVFSGCVFETCPDGTFYGDCSENRPDYYCTFQGKLVEDVNRCGLEKFNFDKNFSDAVKKCRDGARNWDCSKNKPFYCENGVLVKNAVVCGCPNGMELIGEKCSEIIVPKIWDGEFSYTLRGESGILKVSLDKGLKDYLSGIPRTFVCNPVCPSRTQLELRFLDNERQKPALEQIAQQIREKTGNPDDQARIAVSLVQKIPYDMNALLADSNYQRFPYEVVYDYNGICGEKSDLLVFLLREFGFGTAIFIFEKENHAAVGIKCPAQYGYKNTGYCFIESTKPSIITDSDANYLLAGKLESMPLVLKISDGNSFDSVKEEFEDNQQYKKLLKLNNWKTYLQWRALRDKYGFQKTSCDANQNYCDGACLNSCGQNFLFVCNNKGGYCTPNPDNCPPKTTACMETCIPDCKKGTIECEMIEKACKTAK